MPDLSSKQVIHSTWCEYLYTHTLYSAFVLLIAICHSSLRSTTYILESQKNNSLFLSWTEPFTFSYSYRMESFKQKQSYFFLFLSFLPSTETGQEQQP